MRIDGPVRRAAGRQRHVFVVGAIGLGAAAQEGGRVAVVLVDGVGVVVLDLVVVPDHRPGRGLVGGLQQRVAAVGGVAHALAGDVHRLGVLVAAHASPLAGSPS